MLLTAENAVAVADSYGLLIGSPTPTVSDLSAGGVSNAVFKLESESVCLVLKQPLARLRVQTEWRIDRVRIFREAEGMRLWKSLVARDAVPAVHFVDKANYILAMSCAPPEHRNWKQELLARRLDPAAARALGIMLADWQRAGGDDDLPRKLPATDTFVQGRLDPYLGDRLRGRHPSLASALTTLSAELLANRRCLVHGDYSPKNVLVGEEGSVCLLDFEICHFGHPAFDPAFMLTHLVLKSQHMPRAAGGFIALAEVFWDSYTSRLGRWLMPDQESITVRCLGGLLLARVDGQSPAEYLTDPGARRRVVDLGHRLLRNDSGTIGNACRMAAQCANESSLRT
ncbi:MAG: aminoglycoside phosphotransferase family protein [Chloroflexi bacterium]|nr:aminoglycoside phosphotransferase family protein [Chloroflexota bacterium]MDE2703270.1 aminoglycoside phosphotransferase family protein [Chloroflexota bacterium]MXX99824.1 aminoglycoside phosphotransferase family protein [Chloroflexota bacterium]